MVINPNRVDSKLQNFLGFLGYFNELLALSTGKLYYYVGM